MSKKLTKNLLAPKKILIVDDDIDFRQEFCDAFGDIGIKEACSGEEALAILKKPNEIDLVILDYRMANMDGIEVLRRIKQLSPQVNIVIMTGYGSKDLAVEALKARADDFIEKPLDISATKEIIERILGAKKADIYDYDSKAKVDRVKEYMERNCLRKITLEDAAKIVFLSPKYLSRLFKKYAKTGFNEYKLKLKINRAKIMLKDSSYNINLISDKLGYLNAESFIRQFKKITKSTPTQFRKLARMHRKINL